MSTVNGKLRPNLRDPPCAIGDITLKPGETTHEFIAWSKPAAEPYNSSPLFSEGRLYEFVFLRVVVGMSGIIAFEAIIG
jgi:hypothetical protein